MVNKDETGLRLECLKLAVSSAQVSGHPLILAREFYTFLREKDGTNVIDAVDKKPRIRLLPS
jgi:hypothetical protein